MRTVALHKMPAKLLAVFGLAALLVFSVVYRRPAGPTYFRTMQMRYDGMVRATEGLQRTGVPLVGYAQEQFLSTVTWDDQGLYILVPQVARLFHLPVALAFDGTLGVLIFLGVIVGALGFGSFDIRSAILFSVTAALIARAG